MGQLPLVYKNKGKRYSDTVALFCMCSFSSEFKELLANYDKEQPPMSGLLSSFPIAVIIRLRLAEICGKNLTVD